MFNSIKSYKLWEVNKILSQTAMGKLPAETVIKNGNVINVCTKEIMYGVDVAITKGRIALVGDATKLISETTKVIDASGIFLAPGFLDGHIHTESSMMSVTEYANAVIPHGTVGIYSDPHEICNVLGMDGVKLLMEESKNSPLKNMITMPSCVPGVTGFEDTGADIDAKTVAKAMELDNIVGLGEMMNFPGILSGEDRPLDIVAETLKAGKVATGHYIAQDLNNGLNAYIASGCRCCHESTTEQEALAKMRLGMYAMLREGSSWFDLEEVGKAVTKHQIDSRFAVLVSDDCHPETLITKGHLDHIIKRAVQEGIDVLTAIQMVTINCAECFKMADDLGSITPGKCADIVFIKDLESLEILKTVIDGEVVAENGRMVTPIKRLAYPEYALNTIKIKENIDKNSFKIPCGGTEAKVRVIEIIPDKTLTMEKFYNLKVINGEIMPDIKNDICKAVVFERHNNTGSKGYGFIKGLNLKGGAVASTVAHDAHNLIVIGTNDEDMVVAANTLKECGGGQVVVLNGKVLALLPLPVAGLINDKPAKEMSELIKKLHEAYHKIGTNKNAPFMTLAIICLACIPEVRLTNRGIVDCRTFTFSDLIVETK